MFLLRGFLISAAVFVIVYGGLSAAVAFGWRFSERSRYLRASAPRFLLSLRFAPVVLTASLVALIVVPSFLRFEPRSSEEGIGAIPLLLAIVFFITLGTSVWRVVNALRRTNSVVASWMRDAREEKLVGVPVITASGDVPAVALTGICRSRLMISRAAAANLDEQELARAVQHEIAHLRARDNLKKLLLRAVAFPGMRSLEQAWANAAELSADAASVHSEGEALELASALVKISRLRIDCGVPVLASGLVDGPSSLLELRVDRLMNWRADESTATFDWRALAATAVLGLAMVSNYSLVLQAVHAFTESLVR